MRDYGKVYCTFWTSEDTRDLSDDGKLLALYLLTTGHANIVGCFRIPDAYVCDDIGWTAERVSKGFQELLAKGFATRNERSQWIVVHKFLRWNQIENPNQAKAARKAALAIPESSGVLGFMADALRKFCTYSEGWIDNPSERVAEPFRNHVETVSKPTTGTTTETEQKAKPLRASRSAGPLFEKFWNEYPRKVAKTEAEKAFAKISPDQPLFDEILAGLLRANRSAAWLKDGGQFVPHAATWLNGKRWTDQPDAGPAAATAGRQRRMLDGAEVSP